MKTVLTTVYFAAPLFSLAEQAFNRSLADALRHLCPTLRIILPQERTKALITQDNGLALIFQDCLDMIESCDVMIAILDGADADSGTSVELGYAYARKKPIVGIRTDFRGSEDRGLNLMVSHICTILVLGGAENTEGLAVRALAAMDEIAESAL